MDSRDLGRPAASLFLLSHYGTAKIPILRKNALGWQGLKSRGEDVKEYYLDGTPFSLHGTSTEKYPWLPIPYDPEAGPQ